MSTTSNYSFISVPDIAGGTSTGTITSSYVLGGSGPTWSFNTSHVQASITRDINPRLIFKVLKKKMSLTDVKSLKGRMAKLQGMIEAAKEVRQHALHEELAKILSVVVLEQQLAACGIEKFLDITTIKKFQNMSSKNIKFKPLEEYPRLIPTSIRAKIKAIQAKNIFSEYAVLFTDYTAQDIKSTEKKIKEKDPILFGSLFCNKDRHYVIADWIDEHCDLTVDKLEVAVVLDRIPELDTKYVEAILAETRKRHERLQNTNRETWRDLAEKEKKAQESQQERRSWIRRALGLKART